MKWLFEYLPPTWRFLLSATVFATRSEITSIDKFHVIIIYEKAHGTRPVQTPRWIAGGNLYCFKLKDNDEIIVCLFSSSIH